MKNGYDQFFKQARQAANDGTPARPSVKPKFQVNQKEKPRFEMSSERREELLKRKAGVRTRRKKSFPWKLVGVSMLGVLIAGWGALNAEKAENFVKQIEISWMGAADAAESEAKPKSATAKTPGAKAEEVATAASTTEPVKSSSDLDHLSKLTDRQKELDAREEEITRQEGELAKMKLELESRLKELAEMRAKISEILADRVKVDDQKVETLVQMYSNMKPVQAAKIFETLDEDLAVEILSRMKKKNAADLMNLLPAAKAQVFSERYAGYKRAPASTSK